MDPERILLDIDCQRDFFSPGGNYYDATAGKAARNIHRLFAWARANKVPVISTVLRVRPSEIGPLADRPHCVDGTEGEKKLPKTILPRRINMGLRNTTDLPEDIFKSYQQVIFETRDPDLFEHARAERLITELPKATFVLCGAGVSTGIVQTAVGLRSRGFSVILAEDAALVLRPQPAEMAHLRMAAKGVVYAPTAKIVAPQSTPRRRWVFREEEPAGRQTL